MKRYKEAGVDIELAEKLIKDTRELIKQTHYENVLGEYGGFCSYYKIENIILGATSDGVGTKTKLGLKTGKLFGIGIDLVAMNVNDLIAGFTIPMFFMDYIQMNKLDPKKFKDVISGMVYGCKISETSLIGGETAEHPGEEEHLELAGFAVGKAVRIPDYSTIKSGDEIIGISSSGLHSNGFSLINKILKEHNINLQEKASRYIKSYSGDDLIGNILLTPTDIYVKAFKDILTEKTLKGIAHITGGGIKGNLIRILNEDSVAIIEKRNIPSNPVFDFVREYGNVNEEEMYEVFNMGVGVIVIVEEGNGEKFIKHFTNMNKNAFLLGKIEKGKKEIIIK